MTLVAGIQHLRDGIEPQAVLPTNMAVIGVIGTAPDADVQKFPVNEPIQLNTNSPDRADLGSTGTLPDAMTAISAQIAGTQGAAQVIIIRVADDADPLNVISSIVGDEATGTGMWALLRADETFGITPRVLIAPGYTSQQVAGAANAVCAGIVTIAERLKAIFIPEGPTSNRTDWLAWRNTLATSSTIAHPLRQDALEQVGDTLVAKPLSPYVAALYPVVDNERGGVPSGSVANRSLLGLEDVSPRIPFSFTDSTTEGQQDLGVNAGIVARGQSGVSGSIANSGFNFWGTDTLSPDLEYRFANVTRMRNFIELYQVDVMRSFLGRRNITLQTVQAIINTLKGQVSQLVADNHIIDGDVQYVGEQNTPEELRLGNLDITFRAEEPPVLRLLTIRSRKFREALVDLSIRISTQLSQIG